MFWSYMVLKSEFRPRPVHVCNIMQLETHLDAQERPFRSKASSVDSIDGHSGH